MSFQPAFDGAGPVRELAPEARITTAGCGRRTQAERWSRVMYQPTHFREDRLEVQHALIRAHPLGLLVTQAGGDLDANQVPFLLDTTASPLGTLRAHVARANPVWRDLEPAREVMVAFQSVDSYVTPSWYAAKREHGKVVPTWNYAIVQAWGRPRTIEDAAWLGTQIRALTTRHEAARAEPWAVDDAPAPFVATQIKAIVGIEIEITRIEGKWKASQNRPPADREGVVAGLEREGDERSAAMAKMVRERSQPSTESSAANPSR